MEMVMTEATMTEATMTEATMTEATMTEATMTEANMTEVNMTEVNMTEVNVTEANMVESESWACDVLLRDGLPMHIRALRASDREGIVALHERSSAQTHYFRFFNAMPHLNEKLLDQLTNVDQHNRVAIVAEKSERICAVGRYDRTPGSVVAEVAFVVDDPNQGRGISTILLEHLAVIATSQGVERFEAMFLPRIAPCLECFVPQGSRQQPRLRIGQRDWSRLICDQH
jgi:GNAT superfamily N-acetyltransferase